MCLCYSWLLSKIECCQCLSKKGLLPAILRCCSGVIDLKFGHWLDLCASMCLRNVLNVSGSVPGGICNLHLVLPCLLACHILLGVRAPKLPRGWHEHHELWGFKGETGETGKNVKNFIKTSSVLNLVFTCSTWCSTRFYPSVPRAALWDSKKSWDCRCIRLETAGWYIMVPE